MWFLSYVIGGGNAFAKARKKKTPIMQCAKLLIIEVAGKRSISKGMSFAIRNHLAVIMEK